MSRRISKSSLMICKTLVGNVIHQLKSNTNGQSREIILDTSYLDIRDIKVEGGKPLNWEFLPRIEPYGSALKIKLENSVEFGKEIQIDVCCSGPFRVDIQQ